MSTPSNPVAVIGAGPAGLMAAETIAAAGIPVAVFDAMPSAGRKFLLAGRGGLNLTHSEPADRFVQRYGEREADVGRLLQGFDAQALRDWVHALGIETFVGTSGRVFPQEMKAAPLLRAWLHRLRSMGVVFHMRHRWLGWQDGGENNNSLRFATPRGEATVEARATVLALGGASWSRLGSDGAWVPLLAARGVPVAPLLPSNCGFDVAGRQVVDILAPQGWTDFFSSRFAGQPFKSVAIRFQNSQGRIFARRGEFVATTHGVEGSLVYAASALLRDEIARVGHATFHLDLLPDHAPERVLAEIRHPRGARSLSSHLKSRLGLDGIKTALLYELLDKDTLLARPEALATAIKALPITLVAARPVEEAISTAGGVPFETMDAGLMLRGLPGTFCAGEMLDWEAPTGGYLLTACWASGRAAGEGVRRWLGVADAPGLPAMPVSGDGVGAV
jgi:uncharacterized flavoprotein (TIGR03862 family)